MDIERGGRLRRRPRNHILCHIGLQGFQLLGLYREATPAVFVSVLEIISMLLWIFKKGKWGFLGAFLVSFLGLAISLCAHTRGRTSMEARQLAEKIIMLIEIGVPLIQFIATFIFFVLAMLDVKTSFSESLLLPFFLNIVFVAHVCLQIGNEGTDSSSEAHRNTLSGADHIADPLVSNMINVSLKTDVTGDLQSRSTMETNSVAHTSPTDSEVNSVNQLRNVEATCLSSPEYHISTLGDPRTAESPFGTTLIITIDETLSQSSMGASPDARMSPTDSRVSYAIELRNIEVIISSSCAYNNSTTTVDSMSNDLVGPTTTVNSISNDPIGPTTTVDSMSNKPNTTVDSMSNDPIRANIKVDSIANDPIRTVTTIDSMSIDPIKATTTIDSMSNDSIGAATTVDSMSYDPIGATTTVVSMSNDLIRATITVGSMSTDPIGATATIDSMSTEPIEGTTLDSMSNDLIEATTTVDSMSNDLIKATTIVDFMSNDPIRATTIVGSMSDDPIEATTTIDSMSNDPIEATTTVDSISNDPIGATTMVDSMSNDSIGATTKVDSMSNHSIGGTTTVDEPLGNTCIGGPSSCLPPN